MTQRCLVYALAASVFAVPVFAIAAEDTAPDPAQAANAPALSYRAEGATENFSGDTGKVVTEQRLDGSRSYHLNGQGMQSMTASIGADGKLHLQCSDGADKSATQVRPMGNADAQ